jgi:hypothetical protein
MTRIRVFGLPALDSLLLTFLSALEPFLTLGHAYSDQVQSGPTTPRSIDPRLHRSIRPTRARAGLQTSLNRSEKTVAFRHLSEYRSVLASGEPLLAA